MEPLVLIISLAFVAVIGWGYYQMQSTIWKQRDQIANHEILIEGLREQRTILRDGRESMRELLMEQNARIISLTQELDVALNAAQRDN